jgi:kinesin family protein 5
MKEAQAINKSLTELGKLIRSLKDNTYADFRSSKLTYFIHPYLQKGSKAVMFVNVSPALKDESQSINSLKFASIARSCDMGQKST